MIIGLRPHVLARLGAFVAGGGRRSRLFRKHRWQRVRDPMNRLGASIRRGTSNFPGGFPRCGSIRYNVSGLVLHTAWTSTPAPAASPSHRDIRIEAIDAFGKIDPARRSNRYSRRRGRFLAALVVMIASAPLSSSFAQRPPSAAVAPDGYLTLPEKISVQELEGLKATAVDPSAEAAYDLDVRDSTSS